MDLYIEVDDFADHFEKQLKHELLFGTTLHNTSSLDLPSTLFTNNNLNFDELNEDYAISNNHRPKRVCGKCLSTPSKKFSVSAISSALYC